MEFGGNVPAKTCRVSVSGKRNLTVQFDEELWIPIWVPCASKSLKLSIVHSEFVGIRTVIVAVAYIDLASITKVTSEQFLADGIFGKKYDGPRFRWVHFYGANPNVKIGKKAMMMNKVILPTFLLSFSPFISLSLYISFSSSHSYTQQNVCRIQRWVLHTEAVHFWACELSRSQVLDFLS